MFSFLKRNTQPHSLSDVLKTIQTDWHCHLLAGIDDGSQSDNETLAMLRLYEETGIKKIVATPHIHSDYYKNTPLTIAAAHAQAQRLITTNNVQIELEFAAEYFANDHFLELINQNQLLAIENQYVLFELSMQQAPVFGREMIEQIHKLGYTPVLAHPERYRYWHSKPREWAKWRDMGVYFQLNLLSLVGQYGSTERQTAEKMIDLDFIDAVGTDAHSPAHLQKLANLSGNQHFKTLQTLPLLNSL
jgi:protein-tyrosine phosphatase